MDLLAYYPLYIFDHDLNFIPNVHNPESFSPLIVHKNDSEEVDQAMKLFSIYPQFENKDIYLKTIPIAEPNQVPYFSKSLYFLFDMITTSDEPDQIKYNFSIFDFVILDSNKNHILTIHCSMNVDLNKGKNSYDDYQGTLTLNCFDLLNPEIIIYSQPFTKAKDSLSNIIYMNQFFKDLNAQQVLFKFSLLVMVPNN